MAKKLNNDKKEDLRDRSRRPKQVWFTKDGFPVPSGRNHVKGAIPERCEK